MADVVWRSWLRTGRLLVLALFLASPFLLWPTGARAAEPRCFGRSATIEATQRGDRIVGTSGDDVIVGSRGHDEILGRGGDDLICGSGGDDVIRGGDGNDRIRGGSGDDVMRGGSGDDVLIGGRGDDVALGGQGDDVIRGALGNDVIRGGDGRDHINGGQGNNDRCYSGRGNDPPTIGCEGGSDPSNAAPIADDDGPFGVDEDAGPLLETPPGVLDGDTDADGPPPLTAVLATGPSGAASFTLDADGSFDYTPAPDFCGLDTFTYRARDGSGARSAPATVTLDVTCINDEPSFTKGPDETVNEDAGAQTVNGWATAISTGPANESTQTLTFNVTGNTNPSLFSAGPAVSPSGTLTYTPADGMFGSADITLELRDDGGVANGGTDTSSPQTFKIDVISVNTAPTLDMPSGGLTYTENDPATSVAGGPVSITDADNTTSAGATIQITGNYQNGQDVLAFAPIGGNPVTGAFTAATGLMTLTGNGATLAQMEAAIEAVTYANTSDAPSTSQRTVSFRVDDGESADNLSNIETRTIDVTAVNDAPVATAKTLQTHSGIRVSIGSGDAGKLLAGATDADDPSTELTVGAITDVTPSGATVTITDPSTGTFTYNPPAGFSGAASFKFEVCDDGSPVAPQQCSAPATNSVTVTGPDLWFVDDSAGSTGTGRLTDPFDSLADLPAGRGTADRVFVYSGTYPSALTLLASEHLIGQGSGGSFDTVLGVTVPANGTLDARPALGGTRPTLNGDITLGSGNTLRGAQLSGSPALSGTNFGTLTLASSPDVKIDSIGQALSLTTGTVAGGLISTDSDGGTNNVLLSGVQTTGTFSLGTGALSGATGDGLAITGQNGSFSYAGTVSTAATEVVDIANKTGGTVTLSGAISDSSGNGAGIAMTGNNSSTTVSLTGGVTLSTGTGDAFKATGGGTVSVTGSANTLTTTTGTALRVENTTIGSSDLIFRSISSNGAANGIVLNTTGLSGGLTVTGTGTTDATGGTIQNTSSDAVVLAGTTDVSLSNMVIGDGTAVPGQAANATNNIGGDGLSLTNADDVTLTNTKISRTASHGIDGTGVTNLAITGSEVLNAGDGNDENALDFGDLNQNNLEGTVTITNSVIDAFAEDGVRVENFSGTMNMTVSGSTLGRNANTLCGGSRCGENGIQVRADGTAVANLTVTGSSSFPSVDGNGILFVSEGSSTTASRLLVEDNTSISDATAFAVVVFGGTGDHTSTINSRLNFTLDDLNVTGTAGTAISIQPNGNSSVQGTVSDSVIDGSGNGRGIEVLSDDVSDAIVAITNNSTSNTAFQGIFASNQNQGTLDATIRNNTVAAPVDTPTPSGLALHGTEVNVRETSVNCLDIAGNSSAGASGGAAYRTRQRDTSTFRLERFVGDGSNVTDVQNFLVAQNTAGDASATVVTSYTGVADGSCLSPAF